MTTEVEELVREALHERADRVTPAGLRHPAFGPDPRHVAAPRRHRLVPIASGVAVAAAVAVGVALLPGGGTGPVHRTTPAGSTDTPAPSPGATVTHVPGSKIVTPLAAPVTVTGAGTQQVRLGTPPDGTNAIAIRFACLSAGSFWFGPRGTDGPGETCDSTDVTEQSQHPNPSFTLAVKPGQHGTTITATNGARWRLTATYARATISPWGVNANGQTYGVANSHGTPDLIAAMATNGQSGYVRKSAMDIGEPNTPTQAVTWQRARGSEFTVAVPVYASDGTTVLGVFVIGGHGLAAVNQSLGLVTASTSCPDQDGIGFRLNPPADDHGAATPVQAARTLYEHIGLKGYGTPQSDWTATDQTASTAVVATGTTTLHASRQPDGSWVIASGQHCR